ncbi:MAG: hypothetical protein GY925_26415 [Actinomycetia bacterium]|nr:hypothetical protein [Actinomycetes bacterium]
MGADVSRDTFQGVLLADPAWTPDHLWAAESSYDEADPQVGTVEPDSGVSTSLVLEASGTPSSTADLNVRTQRGGHPGAGQAAFAWRTGGTGDWYGWDSPHLLVGWDSPNAVYSTSGNGAFHPRAVRRVGSQGVTIVTSEFVSPDYEIVVFGLGADGEADFGAPVTVYAPDEALHTYPDIVALPSGRLQVFAFVYDTDESLAQVRMWYTDDATGKTGWTLGQTACLPAGIDNSASAVDRLRVSYGSGQWCLVLEHGTNLRQYASTDGALFEEVGSAWAESGHDLLYSQGLFILGYLGSSYLTIRRVGSAFDAFEDAAAIAATVATSTATVALAASEDGALYLYGTPNNALNFALSRDNGATWLEGLSDSGITWGQVGLVNYSACFALGHVVMVGNGTGVAARNGTLYVAHLGGYSTVTYPEASRSRAVDQQSFHSGGWASEDDLSAHFTDNSTGTPTEGFASSGAVTITCGAGDNALYDFTSAAGVDYPEVTALVHLNHTAGATATSVYVRTSKTTPFYTEVRVDFDGATVEAFDTGAGSLAAGTALAGEVDVLVAVRGRSATIWARVYTNTGARAWTQIATTTTLTQTASAVTNRIRLEVAASSTAHFWSCLYQVEATTIGATTLRMGRYLSSGLTNPDDLFGRAYPVLQPGYVGNGLSLRATDGPTYSGETFTMEVQHERGIERFFPTPYRDSSLRWRSLTTTQDMDVAVQLFAGSDRYLLSDTIGIYWIGNCRSVSLEGYSGAAWTQMLDCDLDLSGLRFTRTGNVVIPGTGGSSGSARYFHRHELVGCWFEFPNGDIRPILGNGEGNWDAGAVDEKRPYLLLDDIDDGENASGTTGRIWFNRGAAIIHLGGANTWEGLKVSLRPTSGGGGAPPDGYFEAKCVVGPVVAFGRRPGRQRVLERTHRVDVEEFADGSKRVHQRSAGRQFRRVELSWPELDIRAARGSQDPDYILGTATAGGEPIAHATDTPLQLAGLFEELDGPFQPCVLLPRIPKGPPDTAIALNQRQGGALYGHMRAAGMRIESFLGEPQIDEAVRVPTLVFEEW